jgi:dTDP-glucose 4,6-dehydratase
MKVIVTGGSGFIGSALIRYILSTTNDEILNIDKLTYASSQANLEECNSNPRYNFKQIDICKKELIQEVFYNYKPDAIMHLAAESHVDRSISGPSDFIETNILGTFNLLEASRGYLDNLSDQKKKFRFLHVSTDEVYGDLDINDNPFSEDSPYKPSSPYSATKASSDHLVRAWGRTYNLPVMVSNCSNNYGPYQYPEKLIPLSILKALSGKRIPIYGNGLQIRDWLYVDDHVRGLYEVITKGEIGNTYNIGGGSEIENINVVESICRILDKKVRTKPEGLDSFMNLISFVEDRPGHDKRYSIDYGKIRSELKWSPRETFESGIEKTIDWYLDNIDWCNKG